jgi:hypothetical protein
VSVFRPVRRVSSPDGRPWEIYAYKVRRPRAGKGLRRTRVATWLHSVVTVTVPSLSGDEWTIEAICFVPRETYTWRTTSEFKGQVLARVEGSLARDGEIPARLANATFVGSKRPG